MSMFLVSALIAAAVVAAPYALQLYFQRLPVAPACPSCRATTRAIAERPWLSLAFLPALVATYVGECASCGWRGRLRLRFATGTVPRGDG